MSHGSNESIIGVCFVCLGNICRSPTAEGIFRHILEEAGLSATFDVDSAGTSAYHVGQTPDRRSASAAAKRGITLRGRARQFETDDFSRFDYVIAMDTNNFEELARLADEQVGAGGKLHMLRDFDGSAPPRSDVPDPYYGGSRGFDDVLDICDRGCRGLLAHIRAQHGI